MYTMRSKAERIKAMNLKRLYERLVMYAVIIVICLVFFSPFIYMFSTALKDEEQLLNQPRAFFPLPLHFDNFIKVLKSYDVANYFKNTIIVVIFATAGNLLVSTMAGYALARLRFKGREAIFVITISCMFVPLFLIVIPRFLIFNKLGMIGTLLPLIVPPAFGSPFCIFLVRQFLRSIPIDLSDAARIDGCNEFRIYAQIILPLCKPAIATIIIFSIQWRWNEFIEPLIYLQSEKLYTVTMGLYQILGTSAEEITIHFVLSFLVISILPIIIVFFLAQKQFVEGVTLSGLKG